MNSITNETLVSVHGFITKLNPEQLRLFVLQMQDKQPIIQSYLFSLVHSNITENEHRMLNFIFILIVRCYEYEYGEISLIEEQTVRDFDQEYSAYIMRERKTKLLKKVIHSSSKEAKQYEIVSFLELLVEGYKEIKSQFEDKDKPLVKFAIYTIVILMNTEVKKRNEES